MNPTSPTASGPEGTCRQVLDTLARLERRSPNEGSLRESLDALQPHLQDCPACRSGHATRIERLQALAALRERAAPEGTFDGFYDEVHARVPFAPAGGGMSTAFLDAPRSLRLWRGAALAASVLLVATAGFTVVRGGGTEAPVTAERPLHDPRTRLLEAYEPPSDARRLRDGGRRGLPDFYADPSTKVAPVRHVWR